MGKLGSTENDGETNIIYIYMLGLWWGYPTWQCDFLTWQLVAFAMRFKCEGQWTFVIVGNAFCFVFLFFLVSTGSGSLACSFVSSLVTCSLGWILFWNYTRHMWVNFDPSGISCHLCSKWCYHFVLASPSLLPFRGNKSKKLYTVGKRKKMCKRDDSRGRVLLWSSWVLPGEP